MKPILFNTPMVRKTLSGDKTATRRLVKPAHLKVLGSPYHKLHPEVPEKQLIERLCEPPYQPGDILYVRETWTTGCTFATENRIFYKADGDTDDVLHWCPSIHMPRKYARIFLRVTDVRAERLQEITDDGARKEGIGEFFIGMGESGFAASHDSKTFYEGPIGAFAELWNSTVKPEKRDTYGWAANPWVWVIEFERCEKPEEE